MPCPYPQLAKMDPGFGIVIIIPVVLLAHILREIRRIRQIAEATHLGDQILGEPPPCPPPPFLTILSHGPRPSLGQIPQRPLRHPHFLNLRPAQLLHEPHHVHGRQQGRMGDAAEDAGRVQRHTRGVRGATGEAGYIYYRA
ncbi:hypothetical protein P171DRAFT_225101 [Karstenula rhodostoma CBS 690.94]|uniref:Uncharacterized protein n=1 Tax=Karstenula rhodostoma CBS 690.94 TaxID=1392251 RepID=A0A9P4PR18_9PLEO|nr:hypothetical protein P171DRAFT_225101 [Karstenula rhodostoma CBS 690.94]